MNEELDYAEMLEIPVSTVNVVKKKSLFKRKPKQDDDLKERVVESVNERVGAYAAAEDYSDPPVIQKPRRVGASLVLTCEAIAVCLLAVGIFITNLIMPNSAINTFIASFSAQTSAEELNYSDFTLSSVTSELSDAEVTVYNGAICFTGESAVYPVCSGEVASVLQTSTGGYTVEIAHTSTFTSVITGLTDVYCSAGESVVSNIPVAYSDGSSEVRVCLYDGGELLSGYTLNGVVPVWNS